MLNDIIENFFSQKRRNRLAAKDDNLMYSLTQPSLGKLNRQNREVWIEKSLTDLSAGSRFLDAGAGEMPHKKFCEHLVYVSQDFNQYDGKGDGKAFQQETWDTNLIDIVSDITAVPEPDNSFDAILCSEVLEHVPDPVSALEELTRLLKKGGTLLITAPFCSATHFAPYHFCTGFNRYFYETHLNRLDYQLVEIVENANFFESIFQEIQRIPLIAEKYTNIALTPQEQEAAEILLNALARFSAADNGSQEFSCFGYHVKAVKM